MCLGLVGEHICKMPSRASRMEFLKYGEFLNLRGKKNTRFAFITVNRCIDDNEAWDILTSISGCMKTIFFPPPGTS